MRITIRALLICLALVLCLMPVMIACDSQQDTGNTNEAGNSANNDDGAYEGTPVAKSENVPKTMVLKLHKLAEPDASGVTKCSLVLYDNEGNVLNYVRFDFLGGKAPSVLSLKKTGWTEDSCTATIAHADGTTQDIKIPYIK